MEATLKISDRESMRALAARLAANLRDGDAVLLDGDLGAGKTYLVQGVAEALGCAEAVTSPTFNIFQEYDVGALKLLHFDLYRLEEAEELEDIDFYALVDEATPGAAFVEWADKFPDEMPEDALHMYITVKGDERTVHASSNGPRATQLLTAVRESATSE